MLVENLYTHFMQINFYFYQRKNATYIGVWGKGWGDGSSRYGIFSHSGPFVSSLDLGSNY